MVLALVRPQLALSDPNSQSAAEAVNVELEVVLAGSATRVPLFQDASGTVPLAQPIRTGARGFTQEFYVQVDTLTTVLAWRSGGLQGGFLTIEGQAAALAQDAVDRATVVAEGAVTSARGVNGALVLGTAAGVDLAPITLPIGGEGPRGLPGVNAVPADTAVGQYLAATDSQTRAALAAILAALPAPDGAPAATLPLRAEVDAYGESTTAGAKFETDLASYTGLTITNRGVSGTGVTDHLMRMGAIRPRISLQGGVIPSGSFNLAITSIDPLRGWRRGGSGAFAVGVTVGGLACTLDNDTSINSFRLRGSNPGSPIPVADGTAIVRTPSGITPTRRLIFWGGRNNVTGLVDGTLPLLAEMVALAPEGQLTRVKEVLVLGVINGTTEGTGTTNYKRIIDFNARLAQIFGNTYFDLRAAFIARGMEIRGITPTTADLAAVAADRPPGSLMEAGGGIHPNADGYLAINYLVAEKLLELGWVSTISLPPIPEPEPEPEPEVTWQAVTSDSFNRANGSYGSTDAAAGGAVMAPLAVDSQVGIIDNRFGATTTLTGNRYVYFETGSREVAIEIDHVAGADTFIQVGRADGNNHYVFEARSGSGSGFFRRLSGTKVAIASATQALTAGRLRVEKFDTADGHLRLRAYLDGVLIAERAAAEADAFPTGTKVGVGSPSSGTDWRVDNLLVQKRA